MGKHKITMNLSEESVRNAIKELNQYKSDVLRKTQEYVSRLSELGIQTSKNNVGNFGRYITFSKELEPNKYGCKAIVLATQTGTIVSKWPTKDGIKSADVSPLLMAEFGSGHRAENPMNVPGVGQGTFPDQTHAFDEDGWYWRDLDGELHHSKGVTPSMPMYKAFVEMELSTIRIAREVFG